MCGDLRAEFAWNWLDEFGVSLPPVLYTVIDTAETSPP